MWPQPLCLAPRPPVPLPPAHLPPAHPPNLLLPTQSRLPKARPPPMPSQVTAKQLPLRRRWSAPTLVWPVLKMPRRAVVHDLQPRPAASPFLNRVQRP